MSTQTQPISRQKPTYHLTKWADYEHALVQRGSLTFWLADDFEQGWLSTREPVGVQRPRHWNHAHAEGSIWLVSSMRAGAGDIVVWPVGFGFARAGPYAVCRRSQTISVTLPRRQHQCLDSMLDSTSLKVYGEGEWRARQHGASRRTWRKRHLGVNPETGEVQAALMTDNRVSDDEAVGDLLARIPARLNACLADGAYDKRKVYDQLNAHSPQVTIVIPPRRDARLGQHGNARAERLKRDENVRAIRRLGRQAWKHQACYYQRSLVETTIYRLKTIFGQRLSTRLFETQNTQALIRCAALNRMTQLGMPQSYRVA